MTSQQHAIVYLRDRSVRAAVRAATVTLKLQIIRFITSSDYTESDGRVTAVTDGSVTAESDGRVTAESDGRVTAE